jgi:hypothetical protein
VNAIQTLRPRVRALLLDRAVILFGRSMTVREIAAALDAREANVRRALCSRWFEATADGLRTYRLTEAGRAGT